MTIILDHRHVHFCMLMNMYTGDNCVCAGSRDKASGLWERIWIVSCLQTAFSSTSAESITCTHVR